MQMTSRAFNQDTARAKREAGSGPVFVTDRGTLTHVLLAAADYARLTAPLKTIGERLARDSACRVVGVADGLHATIGRAADVAGRVEGRAFCAAVGVDR